jgi:hypothetical protein
MKRGIALALAAGLTAGSLATGALADHHHGGDKDEDEVKSRITLSNSEAGVYEGTVSSKRAACRKQRRVKVYHDQNENGVDRSDYRIGKDLTDKKGNYEVDGNQAPMGDDVIAIVTGKVLADGTLCLDDDKAIAALSG